MIIAIDVGNSHIRFGGYDADALTFRAAIQTTAGQTRDFYAASCQQMFALYGISVPSIEGAVIACVVPTMTSILSDALSLLGVPKIITVSSGIKTGLNIKTDAPRQIGADRIAAAVGAKLHGKLPCIIVDCGTATTFTLLNENGTLIGSIIGAGVGTSMLALRSVAAQLPLVSLSEDTSEVLCKNTEDAMRVGIVRGAACMIDGLLDLLSSRFSRATQVLLTGGAASLLDAHVTHTHVHADTLCLDGLHEIWKKNQRL